MAICNAPTDDDFRYVLAEVPTASLNEFLCKTHAQLERKKILTDQKFMDKMELVSIDDSGQLSSHNLCFENALIRKSSTGSEGRERTLFLPGQLIATLTNPTATYFMPLFFESIESQPIEGEPLETDTYEKNDREISAAKRLLARLETNYPKRSFCFFRRQPSRREYHR